MPLSLRARAGARSFEMIACVWISPWTMIYRMSRPGENHDSWRRRAMQPRGRGRLRFLRAAGRIQLCVRSRDFLSADQETWLNSEKSRPSMDTSYVWLCARLEQLTKKSLIYV